MSLKNEDSSSSDKAIEASRKMPRHSRISYTREFLLSFSESEVCKKFPLGFDESILGEFADASSSIQDRQRTFGSVSLQGPRRIEYGPSLPTRGDTGTYPRGVYGRWDNRSSGRNDGDLDSQSDKDSDSGRRFGSQSRRSWQGPEHDGLLGSGSFPRPSGFGGGISAPKNHPNDQNQLNKSNEPYHPPRPYKAAPVPKRDTLRDSLNDETFGSNEITSEDRAEEERRRRASFEFMRKEQQKAILEKQKVNVNNHTTNSIPEMSELLNGSRREGKNELDTTATESFSSTESGKSALPSQTCRPLVPPGFTNLATEKMVRSDSSEVGKNEAEECLVQTSGQNGISVPKTSSSNGDQLFLPFLTKDEQNTNSSLSLDGSRKTSGTEDYKHQTPIVSEVRDKLNSDSPGLSLDGELNNKVLEQILGDALSVNVSNSTDKIEIRGDKADDNQTLKAPPHSSKFARWFVEEETKGTTNDMSSSSQKDLLSLLVGSYSNKGKVNDNFTGEISPLLGSEVFSVKSAPSLSSSATFNPSESSIKQEVVVQKVLTCEDLEQTILSEYSGGPPCSEVEVVGGGGGTVTFGLMSEHTDDHASQHLLSLLQMGPPNIMENSAPIKVHTDTKGPGESIEEEEGKNIQPPGKTLTLENLFGVAFMKELQSVEAPVSIHRGGSPRDLVGQQQVTENGVFSSVSEKTSSDTKALNHGNKMKLDKKTDKWMGYDDPVIDLNLSITDFQLPDDLNPRFSKLVPGDNMNQIENSRLVDVGDDGSSFLNGSFIKHLDRNNLSSRDLHPQTSTSNNFQSMHMNLGGGGGKPSTQQLDPHSRGMMNRHHHDVSSNQRPSFHHPPSMSMGVDRAAHHSMLLQQLQMQRQRQMQMQMQMQMHGDYPHPHLVNDFQRGRVVHPPQQAAAGFIHEHGSLQGYPFGHGHGQSNVGGRGIPVAAPDVNGVRRNPEAFQRLVEMELRANSNRIPPFSPWQ